jgi:hypothetical protein
VNGHPPWAPDFTTLGSVNPYSAAQASAAAAAAASQQSSSYPVGHSSSSSDEQQPIIEQHNGQLNLNLNLNLIQHQHHQHIGSKPAESSLTPSSVAFHPPAPSHRLESSFHQQQLASDDHQMIEKSFAKATGTYSYEFVAAR